MFKKIALGLAIIIGGLFAFAAFQPAEYTIAREVSVNATADTLFPYLNNQEKVNSWMPWKDMDAGLKMTFEGPTDGVGAKSLWQSEGRMGVGSAEVIESIPNQSVKTKITYVKPMAFTQVSEMSLSPGPDGSTKVRWAVTGHNNLLGRVMCLFMDMDKMVGTNFEQGLSKLKTSAETVPAKN